jgi:mutator family transposase
VVMEAYVHGVSTRKVDDLVKALGAASGISKSEVSRICAELDRDLDVFRARPLDHVGFPYVFVDATYLKGRVRGRVVSRAVVIATGVTATGDREVLGIDVGDSEDGAFWTAFLKGLRARGLGGVQLVISDHHLGLKTAIGAVFIGAGWQRSSSMYSAVQGCNPTSIWGTGPSASSVETIFQSSSCHRSRKVVVCHPDWGTATPAADSTRTDHTRTTARPASSS